MSGVEELTNIINIIKLEISNLVIDKHQQLNKYNEISNLLNELQQKIKNLTSTEIKYDIERCKLECRQCGTETLINNLCEKCNNKNNRDKCAVCNQFKWIVYDQLCFNCFNFYNK